VDALKRACIKKLPRYLITSLKRFEFDFDTMARVKVNDYYEFP
jgi:ubiquitin carboxyl-terminal hydrolase 9/24